MKKQSWKFTKLISTKLLRTLKIDLILDNENSIIEHFNYIWSSLPIDEIYNIHNEYNFDCNYLSEDSYGEITSIKLGCSRTSKYWTFRTNIDHVSFVDKFRINHNTSRCVVDLLIKNKLPVYDSELKIKIATKMIFKTEY